MTGSDAWGVTPTGYVKPTFEEALSVVQNDFRNLFGQNIDLSNSSIMGQQAAAIARLYSVLTTEDEGVYDSRYIRSATGVSLDRLAETQQTTRNPATYATGYVVFGRASAAAQTYSIPAGTTVATADRSIQYVTTAAGSIGVGMIASGNIPVRSINAGRAYNLQANSISTITTPVLGVDTVTNPAEISGGSDTESDAVFRSRVRTYRPAAKGTIAAYETAILDLDGVVGLSIFEDTNNAIVYIYVVGGDATEISAAIESVRSAGVYAPWARPSQISVNVTASVSASATEIAAAISAYLSNLNVGDDVTYSGLVAAAAAGASDAIILSLSAAAGAQTISALGDAITINYNAVAVAGTILVSEDD